MVVLKEEYAVRCVMDESEFLWRCGNGNDTTKDGSAVLRYVSEGDYPLFGWETDFDGTDLSQFPMVKVQGTLILIDGE